MTNVETTASKTTSPAVSSAVRSVRRRIDAVVSRDLKCRDPRPSRLPARERDDYRQADFERAMESLFKSVDYGRPSDERKKIVRSDRKE